MSSQRITITRRAPSIWMGFALLAAPLGCQPGAAKAPDSATSDAVPTAAPAAAPSPDEVAKQAARDRGQVWLNWIDSGQYAQSWDAAAPLFQSSTSKEQWEKALLGARAPLGGLSSRELRAAEYKTSLEGAPVGKYVVIHYDSGFANKPRAREIVTLKQQPDESWKVAGYFVE